VKKFDSLALGTLIGFLTPIITYFLVLKFIYPFEFADKSLQSIWLNMIAPKMISLGVIPNLGFFFLFIYGNRLKSARGVLMATIGYAILVFILKLIW
jgi:hypothetical protein